MPDTMYEDLPSGCIPNAAATLSLIRRFSVWGLGGSDGCDCSHFSVQGFKISVSCRKSEHCVRVWSNCLDWAVSGAIEIAREVLSQLEDAERYEVRFCDYRHDHVSGRWEHGEWVRDMQCCYCEKPRFKEDAYLCESCESKPDIAARFAPMLSDWRMDPKT